jgi:hypothetical protein
MPVVPLSLLSSTHSSSVLSSQVEPVPTQSLNFLCVRLPLLSMLTQLAGHLSMCWFFHHDGLQPDVTWVSRGRLLLMDAKLEAGVV